RPVVITRWPLVRDSATCSARSRQTEARRNSASPSFHVPLFLSYTRGVEATVKDATAVPVLVKRSSGSAVRLPTMVMVVSPTDMGSRFLSGWVTRRPTAYGGSAGRRVRRDGMVGGPG